MVPQRQSRPQAEPRQPRPQQESSARSPLRNNAWHMPGIDMVRNETTLAIYQRPWGSTNAERHYWRSPDTAALIHPPFVQLILISISVGGTGEKIGTP